MEGVTILSQGTHSLLRCEQRLAKPPAEVFAFFADPYNLERITPPFLRFRVLSSSTAAMQQGTRLTYCLRLHGIPLRWASRIDEWEPPFLFTDRQVRGPFRWWHHRHEFLTDNCGTLLRDTVQYRVPFSALQRTIFLAWVGRDLRRIFTYRQQVIEELFGSRRSSPELGSYQA